MVLRALLAACLVACAAAAEAPHQVVVLGMHHSGTSIVTKFLGDAGAYLGAKKELLLQKRNPLKYYERKDVVAADRELMHEAQRYRTAKTDAAGAGRAPAWINYGFAAEEAAEKDVARFSKKAKTIVAALDAGAEAKGSGVWATKDPRMCLTAQHWMPLLSKPVCVLVYRHPALIAESLQCRYQQHKMSVAEASSAWLAYEAAAARACRGKPTVYLSHAELVSQPWKALAGLAADLKKEGVVLPAFGSKVAAAKLEAEVGKWFEPKQDEHADLVAGMVEKQLAPGALKLFRALEAGVAHTAEVAAPAWQPLTRATEQAYATILTGSDVRYLQGALVLGSTISSFDATRDMVALVTPAVPKDFYDELRSVGWTVKPVEAIEEPWFNNPKYPQCVEKESKDKAVRWGRMMSKIHLWQLTQYQKVVYLDADSLVTGAVSDLFALKHKFAAEQGQHHDGFNAGIMALTPAVATFDALLARAALPPPTMFDGLVDCTEQALLNAVLGKSCMKLGKDATDKAAVARPDVPRDYSKAAGYAVHWITKACAKPWSFGMTHENLQSLPARCDKVPFVLWQRRAQKMGLKPMRRRRLQDDAAPAEEAAAAEAPAEEAAAPAEAEAEADVASADDQAASAAALEAKEASGPPGKVKGFTVHKDQMSKLTDDELAALHEKLIGEYDLEYEAAKPAAPAAEYDFEYEETAGQASNSTDGDTKEKTDAAAAEEAAPTPAPTTAEEALPPCREHHTHDCNGNCAPSFWVGNGICDEGRWGAFLNCEKFWNDGGDCDRLVVGPTNGAEAAAPAAEAPAEEAAPAEAEAEAEAPAAEAPAEEAVADIQMSAGTLAASAQGGSTWQAATAVSAMCVAGVALVVVRRRYLHAGPRPSAARDGPYQTFNI